MKRNNPPQNSYVNLTKQHFDLRCAKLFDVTTHPDIFKQLRRFYIAANVLVKESFWFGKPL